MDTVSRYRAAFTGQPLDRVPVCAWLGLQFLARRLGCATTLDVLRCAVHEPMRLVQLQEELGLDPILVTMDDRWFSAHRYWRMVGEYAPEALENWRVQSELLGRSGDFSRLRFTAQTPGGAIHWQYEVGGAMVTQLEPPLKKPEDLDLLVRYLPAPEAFDLRPLAKAVEAVGQRAFTVHNLVGVWGEAVNLRGLAVLSTDLIEQPALVHRISEFLTERAVRKVRHLAQTGVHSIIYDQSWLGAGFGPATYREFMAPYDRAVVQAARAAGLLVSFHNCGKGMKLLEQMVDTGADALETLTPRVASGDFDLAEAKRRVGDRITLCGGFNERILTEASPQEVFEEARRCLDAAAAGGRYVLRACGQILAAQPGTIEAFAAAGREYGCYA